MKLLICASEYYPYGSGIANVLYNVVEQFKKKGIDCTVCSPTGPDIKLGSEKLITKCGIIGLVYYWHQVTQYLKKNDYDILWLHNPFIIGGNRFKHCLVTMHSTYYGESLHQVGTTPLLRIYKRFASSLERFCLVHMNGNSLFTGVGQPVCEELKKIGISRNRVTYIPNGVNTKQFRPSSDKKLLRKKFGIPEDDIALLSVGRLTPAKQPHTMIEFFSHLEKELGDVTLCIAGNGELLEETKRLVEKMGLRKVLFLGHVDHDRDLPDLYACADYYIMTSKYEGGEPVLTVAEAMASGLPCIVSNIPNFQIIEDANCGVIVDFNNIELAAEKIVDYFSSGYVQQSTNARIYATKHLDWKNLAKIYLNEFEKTLVSTNISNN